MCIYLGITAKHLYQTEFKVQVMHVAYWRWQVPLSPGEEKSNSNFSSKKKTLKIVHLVRVFKKLFQ